MSARSPATAASGLPRRLGPRPSLGRKNLAAGRRGRIAAMSADAAATIARRNGRDSRNGRASRATNSNLAGARAGRRAADPAAVEEGVAGAMAKAASSSPRARASRPRRAKRTNLPAAIAAGTIAVEMIAGPRAARRATAVGGGERRHRPDSARASRLTMSHGMTRCSMISPMRRWTATMTWRVVPPTARPVRGSQTAPPRRGSVRDAGGAGAVVAVAAMTPPARATRHLALGPPAEATTGRANEK